jgi:hypothetical protein
VYSSSSPGLNGSLTPFAHTSGLYFNSSPEPQDQEFELFEDLGKKSEEAGYLTVEMGDPGDPLSYYDAKYKAMKMYHDNFKVTKVEDPNMLSIEFEEADDFSLI